MKTGRPDRPASYFELFSAITSHFTIPEYSFLYREAKTFPQNEQRRSFCCGASAFLVVLGVDLEIALGMVLVVLGDVKSRLSTPER